ncbi:hypothetical protein GYH30_021492 [Glycine max]|nr:hypothetical protein GYH30_021492 [Glycine max]
MLVMREGAEGVERRGGFFSFPSLSVTEECHEGVDGAREGFDGGLVNLEDDEAGEEGGGEGVTVGGGGGGQEALGDEADLGVVIQGEVEEEGEGAVAEVGSRDVLEAG